MSLSDSDCGSDSDSSEHTCSVANIQALVTTISTGVPPRPPSRPAGRSSSASVARRGETASKGKKSKSDPLNSTGTRTVTTVTRTKVKVKKRVIVNVSRCRYDSVRRAAKGMGWIVEDYEAPVTPLPAAATSQKRNFGGGPGLPPRRNSVPAAAKPAARASSQTSGSNNGGSVRGLLPEPEWSNSQAALLVRKYRRQYDPEVSCHIYWHDMSVLLPRVSQLRCWQRINHFPGMTIICRKAALAIQLNKLQQRFPDVCTFFPVSFSLKTDRNRLNQYCQSLRKPKTFIMKPNSGCQGKGILLTRHPIKVAATLDDQDYTVQGYIHRPLLIERKKFDMRIYVLVTSVTNLTVFVHREGLVRICSHEYVKPAKHNLGDARAHLTNYALNKDDEDFERNEDEDGDGSRGNKRDFSFLERYINSVGAEAALQTRPPPTSTCTSTTTTTVEPSTARRSGSGSSGGGGSAGLLQRSSSMSRTTRFGPPAGTILPPLSPSSVCSTDTVDANQRATGAGGVRDRNSGPPVEEEEGEGDDEVETDSSPTIGGCSTSSATISTQQQPLTPWQRLWQKIDQSIILTIASGLESVQRDFLSGTSSSVKAKDGRMCFELLGFDILVTQSMQPYVIEVNHSPSLTTDSPLDERIKDKVLLDVFRQLNPFLVDVRKAGELQYGKQVLAKQQISPNETIDPRSVRYVEEVAHADSGFRRIYPFPQLQVDRSGDALPEAGSIDAEKASSGGGGGAKSTDGSDADPHSGGPDTASAAVYDRVMAELLPQVPPPRRKKYDDISEDDEVC